MVYSHGKTSFFLNFVLFKTVRFFLHFLFLNIFQMSGRDRHVFGGQGPQKPMPSLQAEEVSTDGHEQRW